MAGTIIGVIVAVVVTLLIAVPLLARLLLTIKCRKMQKLLAQQKTEQEAS